MPLNIDLENMGGEETSFELETNSLDDTMALALEHENGIEIEFPDRRQAEAMRFRFYRRIKKHRKAGVKGFDSLIIQLEGSILRLTKLPDFKVKVL